MKQKLFGTCYTKEDIGTDSYNKDRITKMLDERYYWLTQRNQAKIVRKREFCQSMAEMYKKRIQWYLR